MFGKTLFGLVVGFAFVGMTACERPADREFQETDPLVTEPATERFETEPAPERIETDEDTVMLHDPAVPTPDAAY